MDLQTRLGEALHAFMQNPALAGTASLNVEHHIEAGRIAQSTFSAFIDPHTHRAIPAFQIDNGADGSLRLSVLDFSPRRPMPWTESFPPAILNALVIAVNHSAILPPAVARTLFSAAIAPHTPTGDFSNENTPFHASATLTRSHQVGGFGDTLRRYEKLNTSSFDEGL